jgi:dethiobiotin synthetase
MSLPGLFVVGTDTGVGKTFVASAIARTWRSAGRRVGVLKPAASGAEWREGRLVADDAARLIEAIGGGVPQDRVVPLVFEEPLAPPVAARRQGKPLDFARVVEVVADGLDWWESRADAMVVEGVGGLLCPLAEGATVADLAIALDYPLLIVAHRGLGTLNHTLLTVEAARSRALRIAGIVLNGARPTEDPIAEESNADELARRLGDVAILAEWPHGRSAGFEPVAPEAGGWYDLAKAPRFAGLRAEKVATTGR